MKAITASIPRTRRPSCCRSAAPNRARNKPSSARGLAQQTLLAEKVDDGGHAVAAAQVRENKRPLAALLLGIARHDVQVRALVRNFLAAGDVDHVQRQVR